MNAPRPAPSPAADRKPRWTQAARNFGPPGERWPYRLSDYPPGEVVLQTGPLRIRFELPDEYGRSLPEIHRWFADPAAPAQVHVRLRDSGRERDGSPDGYERVDERGFAYRSDTVRGEFDRLGGRGHFEVHRADLYGERPPEAALHDVARAVTHDAVLRRGGVLLHAATLLIDGGVRVACGRSGAGKTTLHARFGPTSPPSPLGRLSMGDEWAFLVPAPAGRVQSWWWAASRGPLAARPWVSETVALLELSEDRSRTALLPRSRTEVAASLVRNAFFIEGYDRQPVLDGCVELAGRLPGALFSHCLDTPAAEVAACLSRIGGAP